ncbi:hypothetical protein VCRA2122O339_120024 [Vibrio crassostreae]|nr:hypothetical protein VCRA2120E331_120024 [Vibrio crassostreae]CAK3168402.1 hypothetical protein VCRA2127O345_120024 [Vibrio crassostreae]CAK3203891.1 hypothetical protein VCRA2122O339_120024 [Vibrio crassostreae]CAK3205569.1 hypothetical protein VCRA2122O338_120024 [Vibrio crassostreae]CAK3205979.1 hypothetical protein VCRA2120E330_130136 [Vibrio crassostreae]
MEFRQRGKLSQPRFIALDIDRRDTNQLLTNKRAVMRCLFVICHHTKRHRFIRPKHLMPNRKYLRRRKLFYFHILGLTPDLMTLVVIAALVIAMIVITKLIITKIGKSLSDNALIPLPLWMR